MVISSLVWTSSFLCPELNTQYLMKHPRNKFSQLHIESNPITSAQALSFLSSFFWYKPRDSGQLNMYVLSVMSSSCSRSSRSEWFQLHFDSEYSFRIYHLFLWLSNEYWISSERSYNSCATVNERGEWDWCKCHETFPMLCSRIVVSCQAFDMPFSCTSHKRHPRSIVQRLWMLRMLTSFYPKSEWYWLTCEFVAVVEHVAMSYVIISLYMWWWLTHFVFSVGLSNLVYVFPVLISTYLLRCQGDIDSRAPRFLSSIARIAFLLLYLCVSDFRILGMCLVIAMPSILMLRCSPIQKFSISTTRKVLFFSRISKDMAGNKSAYCVWLICPMNADEGATERCRIRNWRECLATEEYNLT